ncbi:MAG TPA: ABC transporter ATP-binding protein [Thermoanaerobaculia bacterium]|nr:ABC transporter ATP-binding protein [Thermoanaerobaculia bacterium]
MNEPAVRARGLGKKYLLGGSQASVRDLRDALRHAVAAPLRWAGRRDAGARATRQEFWALREVDFDVAPGETVGVIGRNGAGKSTLLKILSRITEPTEGWAEVRGRVSSLLEVGTGFHPELTGRENVFLNGAILGMRRTEIARKFDRIVAFAEVEPFIDTPVKHYSSGMKVRLAFSVAAHLEPEVLIIDEVLAVGDAAFQAKCLGKMGEVSGEGRTVLFVSHNMSAVQTLCERAIWLERGQVEAEGASGDVIQDYLGRLAEVAKADVLARSSDGCFELRRVVLRNGDGREAAALEPGTALTVDIEYTAREPVERPYLWIGIYGQHGPLFGANMLLDGHRADRLEGSGTIRCTFPHLPLLPQQTYLLRVGGRTADGRHLLIPSTEVGLFRVTGRARGLGLHGVMADALAGGSTPVLVPYRWEFADGSVHEVASETWGK